MERDKLIKTLSERLGVDESKSEKILNEILAVNVVPNLFRKAAVARISTVTGLGREKSELAINEFVGAVTAQAALFEEVVGGFVHGVATENKCDDCNGCDACDAISQLASLKTHLARGG